MNTSRHLQTLLKEADPVSREPGLSASDTARMRQNVLHACGDAGRRRAVWFPMSAAGAVMALLLIAITLLNLQLSSNRPPTGGTVTRKAVAPAAETLERRQVQFATPGGTRIIWTLNPEFTVGGLAP